MVKKAMSGLTASELEARFLAVKPLILEAGYRVKSMRDIGNLKVEIKPDGSKVTNADRWGDDFLTQKLSGLFPEDAVIGEESPDKSYPSHIRGIWYVDPIDGTRAYVDGLRDYYVLIGYCIDGIPVLGLHYQPETGILIYGWSGKKPQIQKPRQKSQHCKPVHYWKPNPSLFIKSYDARIREEVKSFGVNRAKFAKGMVDMIAPLFGKAEGFVSYRETNFWDLAAPAAIMNAAGFIHPGASGKVLFNSGEISTPFYYALPPDTPDDFISHILNIRELYQSR